MGKGITYDTGGLNIKVNSLVNSNLNPVPTIIETPTSTFPEIQATGSMENMHLDMGGSAAVLGTVT